MKYKPSFTNGNATTYLKSLRCERIQLPYRTSKLSTNLKMTLHNITNTMRTQHNQQQRLQLHRLPVEVLMIKIAIVNTAKEVKPFPFVVKHFKEICDSCHKKASLKGSSRPLTIHMQHENTYNQRCLKCRQKYYQQNPEKHRENKLMTGTINRTSAMELYNLSSYDLEAIPYKATQHSKYGTAVYTFKCAEVFRQACLVHGGVVGLRYVSKAVDDVYHK